MIASPCIKQCLIRSKVCTGCHRTIKEIVDWVIMTDEQKQEVLERIAEHGSSNDHGGSTN